MEHGPFFDDKHYDFGIKHGDVPVRKLCKLLNYLQRVKARHSVLWCFIIMCVVYLAGNKIQITTRLLEIIFFRRISCFPPFNPWNKRNKQTFFVVDALITLGNCRTSGSSMVSINPTNVACVDAVVDMIISRRELWKIISLVYYGIFMYRSIIRPSKAKCNQKSEGSSHPMNSTYFP